MSRTPKVLLVAAALLFGLVVTAPYTLPSLIEAAGTRYLQSQGIAPVSFRVADLSTDRIVLADLVIGAGLRMDRAEATFDLLTRTAGTVTFHRPVIAARWTAEGVEIPGLGTLPMGGDGGGTAAVPLERLKIVAGHGVIEVADGRVAARLDADLTLARPTPWAITGTADGTLTVSHVTLPGIAENLSFTADLTLEGDDGGYALTAQAPVALSADRLLHPDSPITGPVEATLSGAGEGRPMAVTVRRQEGAQLGVTLAVAGHAAAEGQRISAVVDGGVTVDASGAVRGSTFSRLEVSGTGLVTPVGTADVALRFSDLGGIPADATGAYALDLTVENLATADIAAPQAHLSAEGTARWSGFATLLDIDTAIFRVKGPATVGALTLPQGLDWALEPANDLPALEVAVGTDGDTTLIPRLALVAPRLHVHTRATSLTAAFGRGEVEGVLTLPATSLSQLGVRLSDGTIETANITFHDVNGTLMREHDRTAFDVSAAVRRLPGEAGSFPGPAGRSRPYTLRGHGESAGDAPWTFSAVATDATGRRIVSAQGQHDIATTRGAARLWTPTLAFAPGAFQPDDIHDALAATGAVFAGEAAARGTLRWTAERLTPDIEVMLRDMTITRDFLKLQRLNTVIRLTKLWPPATPRGQRASLAAVDAGLQFQDVLATFRLDGRGGLALDAASLHLAGGTITAPAAHIPLDLHETEVTLHVADVQLGPLVETTGIENLMAEGKLSGSLPVHVRDGAVSFRDGKLRTATPGVIRYTPDTPPSQLSTAGQSAALVLQVLENFHYKSLELNLNGQVGGDFVVSLHAQGANPDFYQGYPIELNLNVSGALTEIIGRGLTGYRVPAQIRERLRQFESGR